MYTNKEPVSHYTPSCLSRGSRPMYRGRGGSNQSKYNMNYQSISEGRISDSDRNYSSDNRNNMNETEWQNKEELDGLGQHNFQSISEGNTFEYEKINDSSDDKSNKNKAKSSIYAEVPNSRGSNHIHEMIQLLVTKLELIKLLENHFVEGIKNVVNVYSPIKDWGEAESKKTMEVLEDQKKALLEEYIKGRKIQNQIKDVKLKVAIFGDVSVGKSQVMNCMLGRKLFIPAYCQTTICCVRINLADEGRPESIVITGGQVKVCNTEEEIRMEIKKRANLSGCNIMQGNQELNIMIKSTEINRVLRENVTLIDCPGRYNSEGMRNVMAKVVEEADVFILVIAQTIYDQQRIIFNDIMKSTSVDNVFVLVNKWDESDHDDPADTAVARKYLTENIPVWLRSTADNVKDLCKERIFFISANETLKNKTEIPFLSASEPQRKRLDEFSRFEKILRAYLDNPMEVKIGKYMIDANIMEIKMRLLDTLLCLREKRKECQTMIETKIDTLLNVKKDLFNEIRKKTQGLVENSNEVPINGLLDRIETEVGKFVVIPVERNTWYGSVTGMFWWPYSRKKYDFDASIPRDPKKRYQDQLRERLEEYVSKQIDLIKDSLSKELKQYVDYNKTMEQYSFDWQKNT